MENQNSHCVQGNTKANIEAQLLTDAGYSPDCASLPDVNCGNFSPSFQESESCKLKLEWNKKNGSSNVESNILGVTPKENDIDVDAPQKENGIDVDTLPKENGIDVDVLSKKSDTDVDTPPKENDVDINLPKENDIDVGDTPPKENNMGREARVMGGDEFVDFTHLVSIVENDVQDISAKIRTAVSEFHISCEENEPTGFNNFDLLPKEMVLKIFSYLEQIEVARFITPVCRRWHRLAYDPCLWKTLDIDFNPNISSVNLCWIIKKVGCIKKLVLRNRQIFNMAEVLVFTEFCPLLKELDLGFCKTVNKDILECFAKRCQNLEKINVEGCDQVADDCCNVFGNIMCKNLKYLNISHCFVSDNGLKHLAKRVQQIVSLNIDGISWIQDKSILELVEHHYEHLRYLDIDGAELSDKSIQALARCVGLERLTISFCDQLTDAALPNISKLENLKCLALRKGTYFTNGALYELFCDKSMSSLTSLDLSDCDNIEDSTVIQITKCCGTSLRHLYLCWCCYIQEESITAIVDTCSMMETLKLVGIHKIVGESFSRVPNAMPHLRYLDLQQCNKIQDDLIKTVITKKTDLRVVNYYGEEFTRTPETFPTCNDLT